MEITKSGKRRVSAFLLVFIFVVFAYTLGWSSIFTVKQIEVSGTTAISEVNQKLVRDKIAPQSGQKLARVDVRSIENSLVDLDWVKSSSASRDWLSKKIQITVFERVPVARALTAQNKLVNFDSEGVIFTPVSTEQGKNQSSLPLVSAAIASNENLAIVATLMRKLPKDLDYLVTKLDQISVTKAGFILMSTQINGKAVRINWGSIDQIEQKFQVLKALLELPENSSISQVDLSEPNAPIVK